MTLGSRQHWSASVWCHYSSFLVEMSVPSSISSSDERVPALAWRRIFATVLVSTLALVVGVEMALAARNFKPTVIDSEALWLKQRARASRLGKDALILVG